MSAAEDVSHSSEQQRLNDRVPSGETLITFEPLAADAYDQSFGSSCSIETLYEGPSKCSCCINWVEEEPKDTQIRIEDRDENRRHCLLIRMRKNHGEGKPLVLDSIVVQSDILKALLKEVFKGYEGITTSLKKLVFRPPFHVFYYEWNRFNEICAAQPEPGRAQAKLLQDVLKEQLEDTIATSEDLAKNNVITYDYLWTIFQAGIDVYSSQRGHECIYRVLEADYVDTMGEGYFSIKVQYVDCDGKEFGWDSTTLSIWEFSGTRSLDTLEAIPLTLYPAADVAKAKLTARGRSFRDYTTPIFQYAACKGLAKDTVGKRFKVDGRIVLDGTAFELFNAGQRLDLRAITSMGGKEEIDLADRSRRHSSSSSRTRSISPPIIIAPRRARPRGRYMDDASSRSSSRNLPDKEAKRPELDDELLVYCSPEVRGYCLKSKRWAVFAVESVGNIRWNVDAFDSLVMAPDLKRMILSFVETQVASKDTFDDIIEGKGRGIILLLEGSPGVGKTLTAEAVADKLHRPLYAISGGELGHKTFELERSLEMILDIATKWDAVLLLDECDVFLEKRSAENMQRNGIVAVFLRTLEYYNGILFMTTNRVNSIDPAFQSRIHLTIEYPDLDFAARKQVWTRFLGVFCADSKFSDGDVAELAKEDLNGREIKNLIKTAQLLATYDKVPLGLIHVKTVLGVTKRKAIVEIKKDI